jgi:signal transduction histidine kinase
LVKAGEDKATLAILASELDKEYGDATDSYGHLIVPDVQLWALEEIARPGTDEFGEILKALVARLEDYGDPLLAASQRRFLMQRLGEVVSDCPHFHTLEAEILAAEYLERRGSSRIPAGRCRLRDSGIEDVWELVSSDTSLPVVALFRQSRIFQEMESLIESEMSVPDATIKLVRSNAEPSERSALLVGTAGEYLPDWQLALWLNGSDPFAAAVDNRMAIYLYGGILAVLIIVALAGLLARHIGRQIHLTRLRNDLIATVSHELKTPLASIRALIETLLEGRYHDEAQHREYLQLAAKENERLSRLIDNFLAFSRMERNKRTFEFSEVPVDQIVTAAVDAVREKFQEPGARLDVEVDDGLPKINGDTDALTTALVDLLDNAHKYTEDDKHVVLRVLADNGVVRLEVQDNGVGMSRRAARKVFDRFYQVDETLSRRAGGCGLGLSIVQFIITAHGGSVGVTSELGQGSTFTITLPAAQTTAVSDDERKR